MANVYWTQERRKKAVDEICRKIIEDNASLKSIINTRDPKQLPSMPTFMEWCEEDSAIANQYARAMEIRQDALFEEVLEIADKQDADVIMNDNGQPMINHNIVQRNKLQVDTRKWVLAKMNPKKYGDKVDLTTNGKSISQLPPWMEEAKDKNASQS